MLTKCMLVLIVWSLLRGHPNTAVREASLVCPFGLTLRQDFDHLSHNVLSLFWVNGVMDGSSMRQTAQRRQSFNS